MLPLGIPPGIMPLGIPMPPGWLSAESRHPSPSTSLSSWSIRFSTIVWRAWRRFSMSSRSRFTLRLDRHQFQFALALLEVELPLDDVKEIRA